MRNKYNYANLDEKEFVNFCRDILSIKLGKELRSFGEGKDGGIDLTDDPFQPTIIVQVKHYVKTAVDKLIIKLKQERKKIERFKECNFTYYICCSNELLPQHIKELVQYFKAYNMSSDNVITKIELDKMLDRDEYKAIFIQYQSLLCPQRDVEPEYINFDAIRDNQDYRTPYINDGQAPESLLALIDGKVNWIRGIHGTGKTTYMRKLANTAFNTKEKGRFRCYVWVQYRENLANSIMASLEKFQKKIKDINYDDCILFIDNADKKIEEELKDYKFYCIITTSSIGGTTSVSLNPNEEKCLRIFCNEINNTYDPKNKILKDIVKRTAYLPLVAHILGVQALSYLSTGKSLYDYLKNLDKEGFDLKINNENKEMASVAESIAKRFFQDYQNLSQEERDVLSCFCLLGGSGAPVAPRKIEWERDHYEVFDSLVKKGFLNTVDNDCYVMHDIMVAAVTKLCREITYNNVKSLVDALAKCLDRDTLHGSDMMSVYHEAYYAYSIFIHLSGKNYATKEKHDIESFEYEQPYAWMVNNLFSAFDDYNDSSAYNGTKYAAMLCKESHEKKGLPTYKLVISYISAGYMPSVYSELGTVEKQLIHCVENLDYLLKAKELLEHMEAGGENYPSLKATIHSNLGAVWQRLHRIFSTKSAIDRAVDEHIQAMNIRRDIFNSHNEDDAAKDFLHFMVARSMYTLATDFYYKGDFEASIKQHQNTINEYKKIGTNQDSNLYFSYSRLASTEYQCAKKMKNGKELWKAYTDYKKAYGYLINLSPENQMKAEEFYRQFLTVTVILARYHQTMQVLDCQTMINPLVQEIEKIMYHEEKAQTEIDDFKATYLFWGQDEEYIF